MFSAVTGKGYVTHDQRVVNKHFWNAEIKEMTGFAEFSNLIEGPPGCVHGGCLAAVMDELLGWTTFTHIAPHKGAVTVNLNVNYKKFVPLSTVKKLVARVDKQEGRKVFVSGRIVDGGDESIVHVEATAIFLMINVDKVKQASSTATTATTQPQTNSNTAASSQH